MQQSPSIAVRTMTAADVPFGMKLKDDARWNQTESDWLRFLTMEPEGCFVAECDGRPAGTTVATVLGSVGWIAMVLVERSLRGRGIGTRLVAEAIDYLERRSVPTARLDATSDGRPVYEKLGFVPEYEVARWAGTALAAAPHGQAVLSPYSANEDGDREGMGTVTMDELGPVAELDGQVTGADRRRLIECLYGQWPDAMRVWRTSRRLMGYAMVRPGTRAFQIGPAAAIDAVAGTALVEAALQSRPGQAVFVDIPVDNVAASRWADSRGLTLQRRWMRMRRGQPVHDHPGQFWLSSGPENG